MLDKRSSNHGNKSQLVGTRPKKAVTEVTTRIHIYILFLKKTTIFYFTIKKAFFVIVNKKIVVPFAIPLKIMYIIYQITIYQITIY
jgi:hypothetical protein